MRTLVSSLAVLALFVILTAATSTTANAQVQQYQFGTFELNDKTPEYILHRGSGPREFTYEVNFKTPFKVDPDVVISVNYLDASSTNNIRYRVRTSSIFRDGFVIKVKTWHDTVITGIGGTWLAISN